MKRSRKEADELELIKRIIVEWKPFNWLEDDVDDPELDGEVFAIYKQRGRMKSQLDAAHVVSRVFCSSFHREERFSVESCKEVGAKLFTALKRDQLDFEHR